MTVLTDNMTFRTFMAPFHRVGENPTCLERDLELIEWLDDLGSMKRGSASTTAAAGRRSPLRSVYCTAAGRTRHIRLGTGVVSLPYHHPTWSANRMVLLDHLTRGRVMLGVGPGALASDAHMFCIDPERQREMMDESLGVIMQSWTVASRSRAQPNWFQLRMRAPAQALPEADLPVEVASVQSPAGVLLAGKHGVSVISLKRAANVSAAPA